MSDGTGIEWADATWNPVVGCTPVSPGCLNCYAAGMARRLEAMGRSEYVGLTVGKAAKGANAAKAANEDGKRRAVFSGTVRCLEDRLTIPLGWRKPRRIFVNSMSDLFHESVPFEFIDRVFAVMAACPQHTFQVLTKRPEWMAEYLDSLSLGKSPGDIYQQLMWALTSGTRRPEGDKSPLVASGASSFAWPLPNVWLGASVEDQARADKRIPNLLQCPAAVRFLSCEPLLGPVDLSAFFGGRYVGLPGDVVHPNYNFGIDWVIVGGESGPNARPCEIAWVRSIVEQCKAASVPVFVKQLGSNAGWQAPAPVTVTHRGGERRAAGAPFPIPTGFRRLPFKSAKGGDPAEWPEDLRVMEWPRGVEHGSVSTVRE